MFPTTFSELDRRDRRRLVMKSLVRILLTTAVLIALYVALPDTGRSGARAALELIFGLLIFAAVMVWQVNSVLGAEHPELRAVEALAAAVPVLIMVFAFTYLSMYRANHANFSEPLDHVGAVYFTVSVISTVGFGDIVAKTDGARLLVTVQLLLDLVVVVGIVRTIVYAARVGVKRQAGTRASSAAADPD